MFGDVGQARTNVAMLLLPIDTTLSRTCTKPTVVRSIILGQIMSVSKKVQTHLVQEQAL